MAILTVAVVRVCAGADGPAPWRPPGATDRDAWAFQPVRRVTPPPVAGVENPIDRFVMAEWRRRGIRGAPEADRRTLIRRVTFDLHGLPPTVGEVERFLADRRPTPGALESVIDRLLASPRYGERLARRWLDVARYADTAGGSNDFERPNAWRYRDYVVRAFNEDRAYDRFVTDQVAGDEVRPGDPEGLVATGFLRMGPWEHTAMSVEAVTRQQWLDDVTASVGNTFLGLTVGCARCHDHKFDPISTQDYYRLQAVFASTRFAEKPAAWLPGENRAHFERDRRDLTEKLAFLDRQSALQREKIRRAAALRHGTTDPAALPLALFQAAQREQLGLDSSDLERQRIYGKWRQLYQAMLPRTDPVALTVATAAAPDPPTHVLIGGRIDTRGPRVEPGFPTALSASMGAPTPEEGPAGRLALARWMTSPGNPVTARVMVNRVWQWHFGRGLVDAVNNLGKMGGAPSHPDLLDWLAQRFVAGGWKLKALHRLILTSEAYRRASVGGDPKRDPEARFLSRFRVRRLEAEELRDGLLAVSGRLSLESGGPGALPELNDQLAAQPRQVMGTIAPSWEPSPTPAERNRRTLYTYQQRSMLDPFVEAFNGAPANESCERRLESTVAPQVFQLFNSRFSRRSAAALAQSLVRSGETDPTALVRAAFRRVLQRSPSRTELVGALSLLARSTTDETGDTLPGAPAAARSRIRRAVVEQTGETVEIEEPLSGRGYQTEGESVPPSSLERGLAAVCLALMNTNEMVYVY